MVKCHEQCTYMHSKVAQQHMWETNRIPERSLRVGTSLGVMPGSDMGGVVCAEGGQSRGVVNGVVSAPNTPPAAGLLLDHLQAQPEYDGGAKPVLHELRTHTSNGDCRQAGPEAEAASEWSQHQSGR